MRLGLPGGPRPNLVWWIIYRRNRLGFPSSPPTSTSALEKLSSLSPPFSSFPSVQSASQTDVNPVSTIVKVSQLVISGIGKSTDMGLTTPQTLSTGVVSAGSTTHATDDLKTDHTPCVYPRTSSSPSSLDPSLRSSSMSDSSQSSPLRLSVPSSPSSTTLVRTVPRPPPRGRRLPLPCRPRSSRPSYLHIHRRWVADRSFSP